jgi:hypothetical protein
MTILKNLFSKNVGRNGQLEVQEHLESFITYKKVKILLRDKFLLRKKFIKEHNNKVFLNSIGKRTNEMSREIDLITQLYRLQQKLNDTIDDGIIQFYLLKHQGTFENVLVTLLDSVENDIPLSSSTETMLEEMFDDFGKLILSRVEEIKKNNDEMRILEIEAKQKSISEIITFEREFQKNFLL